MAQLQVTSGETVVAFRPSSVRVRARSDAAGEERGRILLFTGVRYERTGDREGRAEAKPAHGHGHADETGH